MSYKNRPTFLVLSRSEISVDLQYIPVHTTVHRRYILT